MPCLRFLFLPLLAALAAGASGAAWRQEVYVWQRQWTPAVNASLQMIDDGIAAAHVLVAEVTFRAGRVEILRVKPDYAALKTLRARVGLVIRIGAFGGPFSAEDSVAGELAALLAEQLALARAAGLEPVELQVDFDCAEAKLAGYCAWMRALRVVAGSTRLVFTALPAWLRHPEAFAVLAREADGFVLQVHSLEKPADVNAPLVLCEPALVRTWVAQASRMGRPFRVALPTYGYEAAFDARGRCVGLAAEGPRRAWPEGTRVRVVRADEAAMAELARELREKPAACEGVIWFRLPVEGDRLNWSVRALAAILRGDAPKAALTSHAVVPADDRGFTEIVIENGGDVAQLRPARVEVRWAAGGRVISADALAGYSVALRPGEACAVFTLSEAQASIALAPGKKSHAGWIRFPHETSIEIKLTSAAAPR